MLKIAKFGGSSCASGEQFRKVKEIVMEDRERHYIVVSAPGKRNDQDTKVTDLLLSLYDAVQNKSGAEAILEKIKNRFRDIISDLDLSLSWAFPGMRHSLCSLLPEASRKSPESQAPEKWTSPNRK